MQVLQQTLINSTAACVQAKQTIHDKVVTVLVELTCFAHLSVTGVA